MYDDFFDYDDNLPRNAPEQIDSTSTFGTPIMQPSVPEVSIIQGPANFNKFGQKTSSARPTNYQQFKYRNYKTKSPTNSPIMTNSSNDCFEPEMSTPTVPEVSILMPPNPNFARTKKNKHGLMDHENSVLPIKSFTSFKREYQRRMETIKNYTKNAKAISNIENLGKTYTAKDNEEIKNALISSQCTCSCNCTFNRNKQQWKEVQNSDLLFKINQLTDLVHTMFIDMIGMKGELFKFKNNVEDHLSAIEKLAATNHKTEMNSTKPFRNCESCNRIEAMNTNENLPSINIDLNGRDLSYKRELPSPLPVVYETTSPDRRATSENKIFDIQGSDNDLLSTDSATTDDSSRPGQRIFRLLDTFNPLPENSLQFPNDRSLAMEKLAAKYLPEGKYEINLNNDNHINNKNVDIEKNLPTDMSMGSYDYLKKYKLLPTANENDENVLFVQDIKKQPKFI